MLCMWIVWYKCFSYYVFMIYLISYVIDDFFGNLWWCFCAINIIIKNWSGAENVDLLHDICGSLAACPLIIIT